MTYDVKLENWVVDINREPLGFRVHGTLVEDNREEGPVDERPYYSSLIRMASPNDFVPGAIVSSTRTSYLLGQHRGEET